MNELRVILAVIAVAAWTVGCGDGSKSAAAGAGQPAGTGPAQAAAAEPDRPPEAAGKGHGGSTPLVQVQQSLAVDQVVEKAASQTDTKAGRKAQARIDEIGKKRADMAEEAGL